MSVELSVTELRSHVRARHASTGRPLAPLHAVLEDPWPGWHLQVKGGDVVVTARQGVPDPEPTSPPAVRLTVGGALGLRLAQPTAVLPLTAAEIVHDFQPIPMTLTAELVASDDGTPSSGRTVKAQGASGAPVDLDEVAGEPGTYRSAARVWSSNFHPLQLRVGTTPIARLTIDFTRTDTRVRVVDPT